MAEDRRQPLERQQRIAARPDGRLVDENALADWRAQGARGEAALPATEILVDPQVQLTLSLEEAKDLLDWATAALAAPGARRSAWPIAQQLRDILAVELGYVVVRPAAQHEGGDQ